MVALRVLFFGFVFLVAGYVYIHAEIFAQEMNPSVIDELITRTELVGLDVQEWQLLARNSQGTIADKKSFKQHVHKLSMTLTDWDVSDADVSGSEWKASAKRDHNGISETLQIFAYSSHGEYVLSHTYVMKGSNPTVLRLEGTKEIFQKRITDFSLNKGDVFTQVQAKMTENKNESLYETASNIVSTLGAVEIEALKEETFVSVSAYNIEWKDGLKTKDKKMNVQVAIRQDIRLGSGTTVTIGTPIITTEY